jgi:uncharacterized protein YndB with AHSA1/START domain
MPTGTVRLHRVLRAKPDKIYRAFIEPDALARWIPPTGSPALSTSSMRRSTGPFT